jgi:hypothetical protein
LNDDVFFLRIAAFIEVQGSKEKKRAELENKQTRFDRGSTVGETCGCF